jgi:hypothetical protein
MGGCAGTGTAFSTALSSGMTFDCTGEWGEEVTAELRNDGRKVTM